MPRPLKEAALAALITCVAFAAGAASAQAPPGQAQLGEGPGGRTALARWTLALDPGNRGLARGWQRGGFPGRGVSVPNDVDPVHVKGRAGRRNYSGSLAWYRTDVTAPDAGTYAFSFASANFKATAYVDGRAIVSHRGSYLPFEGRAQLAAGTHTLVVRIDWRDPGAQSRQGFHRTWFNWGGLNGQVDDAPDRRKRAVGAEHPHDAAARRARRGAGDGHDRRARAQQRAGAGDRSAGDADRRRRRRTEHSDPVPRADRRAGGGDRRDAASVAVADPAVWSPSHPNLYTLALSVAQPGATAPRAATPRASDCASSLGRKGGCCSTGAGCGCTAPRSRRTRRDTATP